MRVLFVWCLCTLGGCAATPYVAPSIDCAARESAKLDPWWQSFGDPGLATVLREARRCNIDLTKKALEMRRYQLESERSDLQLQGQLSTKSHNSLNGETPQQRSHGPSGWCKRP